jgi:hypothetical protein
MNQHETAHRDDEHPSRRRLLENTSELLAVPHYFQDSKDTNHLQGQVNPRQSRYFDELRCRIRFFYIHERKGNS